MLELFEFSGEL